MFFQTKPTTYLNCKMPYKPQSQYKQCWVHWSKPDDYQNKWILFMIKIVYQWSKSFSCLQWVTHTYRLGIRPCDHEASMSSNICYHTLFSKIHSRTFLHDSLSLIFEIQVLPSKAGNIPLLKWCSNESCRMSNIFGAVKKWKGLSFIPSLRNLTSALWVTVLYSHYRLNDFP